MEQQQELLLLTLWLPLCCALQVAAGIFDWLTPLWLLSLVVWAGALYAWPRVQSGELSLPGLVVQPAASVPIDIETGLLGVTEAESDKT